MSGIYIPMEMPTEGFITVTITSDGRVVGNSQKINGKFEYLDNKDIAPAIPVPDHGRLIDADALAKEIEYARFHHSHTDGLAARHHVTEYAHFLNALSEFPTIIPASGGKEYERK